MSNNGIDWIGGLKICFALLGVAAVIAIIIKHQRNKCASVCNAEQNPVQTEVSAQQNVEQTKWLDEAVHSFEKEYCGYLIERNRVERGYTISQMRELQDKYGVIYAEPSFALKTEFYEKYPDEKRSALINLTKQWLINLGEKIEMDNQNDLDDLVDAIKNKAIQNATEEFKKVFKTVIDAAT